MRGLGRVGEEVPDVVRLLVVGVGVGLLGMDEVGELQRVADEEDRGVVPHQVVVSVLGVELDGEPPRVAHCVGRSSAPGHRGEPEEGLGPLADLTEEPCPRPPGDVAGDLESAERGRSVGMDHPLGNALAVEPGELLEEVLILDEHRAGGAGGLAVLVVHHRGAGLRGQCRSFHGHLRGLAVARRPSLASLDKNSSNIRTILIYKSRRQRLNVKAVGLLDGVRAGGGPGDGSGYDPVDRSSASGKTTKREARRQKRRGALRGKRTSSPVISKCWPTAPIPPAGPLRRSGQRV